MIGHIESQPIDAGRCVHADSRRLSCEDALDLCVAVFQRWIEAGACDIAKLCYWLGDINPSQPSRWFNPPSGKRKQRPRPERILYAKRLGRIPQHLARHLPDFDGSGNATVQLPKAKRDPNGNGVDFDNGDMPLIATNYAAATATLARETVYRLSDGVRDATDDAHLLPLEGEACEWGMAMRQGLMGA